MNALQLVQEPSLCVRAVKYALGAWQEVLIAMLAAHREFERIGEHSQAEAIAKDIEHLKQRSVRHIRSMTKASNTNG